MTKQKNALQLAGEDLAAPSADMKAALDLGLRIGRSQALHLVRAITEVGQAREIKRIKESGEYKLTGLNWKQFCAVHLGISHPTADAAIANLDTLGENYFAVNQFVPITPGTFGLIAGKVDNDGVEIDGEKVAFTAANAPRIKRFVEGVRKQALTAKAEAELAENKAKTLTVERDNAKKAAAESRRRMLEALSPEAFKDADDDHRVLLNVQSRVDAAMVMLRKLSERELSEDNRARLIGLVKYLHCELLRAIDEETVSYSTIFDPHDPSGRLYLDGQEDQGRNLVTEFAMARGGKQ